jgi:hypothetical protein
MPEQCYREGPSFYHTLQWTAELANPTHHDFRMLDVELVLPSGTSPIADLKLSGGALRMHSIPKDDDYDFSCTMEAVVAFRDALTNLVDRARLVQSLPPVITAGAA